MPQGRTIVPIFATTTRANMNISRALDAICEIASNPCRGIDHQLMRAQLAICRKFLDTVGDIIDRHEEAVRDGMVDPVETERARRRAANKDLL